VICLPASATSTVTTMSSVALSRLALSSNVGKGHTIANTPNEVNNILQVLLPVHME
jgi:hypothetical protein